jgi:hypothetical protein
VRFLPFLPPASSSRLTLPSLNSPRTFRRPPLPVISCSTAPCWQVRPAGYLVLYPPFDFLEIGRPSSGGAGQGRCYVEVAGVLRMARVRAFTLIFPRFDGSRTREVLGGTASPGLGAFTGLAVNADTCASAR